MKCIVCGSTDIKKIPLIYEVSRYTKVKYPLYNCLNCGLVRPKPLPYNEDTKLAIYDVPENIKFYNKKEKRIEEESYEYKYYAKHFKPYKSLVKKYGIKGRALDIGCGAGHLMDLLSKNGLNSEGMEISPVLVKALEKKYKVYCCELGDKMLKRKKYDLITFNQVLEHIEHPEKFLKEVKNLTAPKGYLIFSVPYLYGLVPNILRTKWYGLGYGQHLNFFSKKSLRILLERNGFEVKEFKVLIVDYAHPKFPAVLNLIANAIMKSIVFFGLGDNLFIVAQRRNGVKK